MNRNATHLLVIIDSIERLELQKAEIAAAIKEQKDQAEAEGYSRKALNIVLARRKMSKAERDELDALVDIYQAELGMLAGTPLGAAAIDRLERKHKEERAADTPEADLPVADPEPEPDTEEEAREKGAAAASEGKPVTANPYRARSPLRAAWDEAWCREKGSDGMDLPEAWRPTPKPKAGKKPSGDGPAGDGGDDEGGDE